MFGLIHLVLAPGLRCLIERRTQKREVLKELEALILMGSLKAAAHSVRPQRRKGLKVVQGCLGSLHSLHAGVDGSCQRLLG